MSDINSIYKFGRTAVWLNIIGIITSGLLFPVLSTVLFPQPQWQNPQLFIDSFHPFQTGTFFCGYILILGSLMTFITLYKLTSEPRKLIGLTALIINIIFTPVVFLNYIIQTTYIPYLAMNNPTEANIILPVFTMANPGSFAWALEMYGWGGIGLSFIFMAFTLGNTKIEKILKTLFIMNGGASVLTALITSVDMNWLFTPYGFASLIIWNSLVLIIDVFLLKFFKMN